MLIDELDKIAREHLEAILRNVDGADMPLDQKTPLRADLMALKDMLGALDMQGLRHVEEVLSSILGMLQPGHLLIFEPASGLLLSLLKFLGGGGGHGEEPEEQRRPSQGMGR